MKQRYKNLVSDSFIFAAGNMLVKIMQFFLLPMYTAYLSAGQYAVGELVNNMAELLYPLVCLGIYEGVFRYSIESGSDESSVFSTGLFVSVAGAPVVVAAGVLGYSVTGFDYTWHLVLLCLAMSLRMVCLQFVKGIGKTKLYAASGVVGTAVLCVSGYVLLGRCGAGVDGYLGALLVSQIVQLAIVIFGAKIWRFVSVSKVDRVLLRKLLVYSLPMIPNSLAWWFVNLSGRYIILFSAGTSVAGLYTAASKLPAVMNMLITIFQQAWQIFSAREYNSRDRDSAFSNVYAVFTALLLCSGSIVIAITMPLSLIMLKGEFYQAYVYVPALMLGSVFNGYSTYFGTLYNAAKSNAMIFGTTMLGAFVNVALGIGLSFFIGPWGPIIGAAIAYLVISLTRIYDTRRFVRVELDARYQMMGLGVILVEVLIIAFKAPFATVWCILLALLFCMGTAAKHRVLLNRLVADCKNAITNR